MFVLKIFWQTLELSLLKIYKQTNKHKVHQLYYANFFNNLFRANNFVIKVVIILIKKEIICLSEFPINHIYLNKNIFLGAIFYQFLLQYLARQKLLCSQLSRDR
jgi:hypothetical protein